MHRNKKDNLELYNDTNSKYDELSECLESSSPILSILRTSFEEPEDKDNDEISSVEKVVPVSSLPCYAKARRWLTTPTAKHLGPLSWTSCCGCPGPAG